MRVLSVDPRDKEYIFAVYEKGKDAITGTVPDEAGIAETALKFGINRQNVLIDSGFRADAIYELCKKHGFTPCKGIDGTTSRFRYAPKHGLRLFIIGNWPKNKSNDTYHDCMHMAKEYWMRVFEKEGEIIDDKRPKVVDIKVNDEASVAFSQLKRDLPNIINHVVLVAKIQKASFDAYIEQGFTEEQALELCKTIAL